MSGTGIRGEAKCWVSLALAHGAAPRLHGGAAKYTPSPRWEGNSKRQTNTNKRNALKEEIRGFHLGREQSCTLENGKAANLKLAK